MAGEFAAKIAFSLSGRTGRRRPNRYALEDTPRRNRGIVRRLLNVDVV